MRIQHNIAALNAHRQLGVNNDSSAKALEKLSSGFRINRAADDAAGLAISEKMRGQVRGLTQASRNAQDGISLIQTAEGGLQESHAILQRMRELAVQSSTGTYTDEDRAELQAEVDQLVEELSRIAGDTEFNTMKLLNGDMAEGTNFHVGANAGQQIGVQIGDMTAKNLGVGEVVSATGAGSGLSGTDVGSYRVTVEKGAGEEGADRYLLVDSKGAEVASGVLQSGDDKVTGIKYTFIEGTDKTISFSFKNDLTGFTALEYGTVKIGYGEEGALEANWSAGIRIDTEEAADEAIKTIQTALEKVSTQRSTLGAVQNRLEHTIANLGVTTENLTAAESRIRDVDMPDEIMEFTKFNILNQASIAMLAQANMQPQAVLQLLG